MPNATHHLGLPVGFYHLLQEIIPGIFSHNQLIDKGTKMDAEQLPIRSRPTANGDAQSILRYLGAGHPPCILRGWALHHRGMQRLCAATGWKAASPAQRLRLLMGIMNRSVEVQVHGRQQWNQLG